MLAQLASTTEQTKNPDFFTFISDFSKAFHGSFTPDNLANLLRALVNRILVDSAPPKKTMNVAKGTVKQTKKGNKELEKIRINKSWGLIRDLAEDATLAAPPEVFEVECRPLLQ